MCRKLLLIVFIHGLLGTMSWAQPNEQKVGAWYMYFWNTTFKESPWGIQGDVQLRNWNVLGDLEQLLIRGGLTYAPKNAKVKFTLGYGNIQTGAYGLDTRNTTSESRIYQEALIPHKLGKRFYLTHRFRFEQRFVQNQDLRTRFRYNLFLNVALNKPKMEKGTLYLALYNELFINGQRETGVGSVELFDRNRSYVAVGYQFAKNMKAQLGYMHQLTDNWGKSQLQISLHHKI